MTSTSEKEEKIPKEASKEQVSPTVVRDINELKFEIDPLKGQETLRKYGYYYNKIGRCVSVKGEGKVGRFPSQQDYENFGDAVEEFIFYVVENYANMKRINIQANPDKSIAPAIIFTSPDYTSKETLLFIIPGSGLWSLYICIYVYICIYICAVRASQWARSLCINDDLSSGTCLPFLHSAEQRDWGVILCDPNARLKKNDADKGRVYPIHHCKYVFKQYVMNVLDKSKIKNVFIVAHSAGLRIALLITHTHTHTHTFTYTQTEPLFFRHIPLFSFICVHLYHFDEPFDGSFFFFLQKKKGGWCTSEVLDDYGEWLAQKNIVRGIAFTDCGDPGSYISKFSFQLYKKCAQNWVTSEYPLGPKMNPTVKRVSAGHRQHEWTSASAYQSIFKFFDKLLGLKLEYNNTSPAVSAQDKSLPSNASIAAPPTSGAARTPSPSARSNTETETKKTNNQGDDRKEEGEADPPKQDPEKNNTDKNNDKTQTNKSEEKTETKQSNNDQEMEDKSRPNPQTADTQPVNTENSVSNNQTNGVDKPIPEAPKS
ncbi:hypothetical protein RFI_03051 [Reticulomyxa filosa]|uniref:Uncharacterized protein n=1 Tax=Reticulomyxa filosa TaxID=46433 RepID=X6P757_RETFI|nr:hypothetical protein RFI_03051 [Reticulomyxa filosa]|eukprot:ETO34041.1 hypothetical protein RFI_03051 [Reticulomyxa filosa]